MASTFSHFIITRYNLPIVGREEWVAENRCLDPEWLEERFVLFTQFLFPSLANQSVKDFHWVILVHPDSPPQYQSKLQSLARTGVANVVLWTHCRNWMVPQSERPNWRGWIQQATGASHVITTRIDSDDAIHRDFILHVQSAFRGQDHQFVEFPRGYILLKRDGTLFQKMQLSNPFVSLIERKGPLLRSVFCGDHAKLRTRGGFLSLDAEPAWLQVVHGGNLSNRTLSDEIVEDGADVLRCDFNVRIGGQDQPPS